MFFLTAFFAGRALGVAMCFPQPASGPTPEVLARTLARARVGARPLTPHGETFAMTEAAVATEVHQALDVRLHLAARVTLDLDRRLDRVADGLDVGFRQLLDPLGLGDVGRRAQALRGREPDAVDVRQGVDNVLPTRKIDASNACHGSSLPLSPAAACGAGCCR